MLRTTITTYQLLLFDKLQAFAAELGAEADFTDVEGGVVVVGGAARAVTFVDPGGVEGEGEAGGAVDGHG